MKALKRIGIDAYMLMLIGMVILGLILPARGVAAEGLRGVTFWAVTLFFSSMGPSWIRPRSGRAS